MHSGYSAIDGFKVESTRPTTSLSAVCALCASCGVFLLAASALKQINTASVANFATPSTAVKPIGTLSSGVLPARSASSAALSQRYGVRGAQAYTPEAADYQAVDELPSAQAGHFMPAVGGLFLAVAGLVGYIARRGERPTLSDTKLKFLELCNSSISAMYNGPLQELLAQHHLIRFNTKYEYDEVFALGISTVLNQLLEGLGEDESLRIQTAYFGALSDDVQQFKSDAAALEEWAKTKGKEAGLKLDDASDPIVAKLKAIAERVAEGKFQYTKFFSIGLFQLLQQSGLTDPDNFTSIIATMSLDKERVTKDLKIYKDLLKRLEMAKDMKAQFLERERKKQEERMAAKKTAEEASESSEAPANV